MPNVFQKKSCLWGAAGRWGLGRAEGGGWWAGLTALSRDQGIGGFNVEASLGDQAEAEKNYQCW